VGLVRALPERASEREQPEGSGDRRRPLHGGEIDMPDIFDRVLPLNLIANTVIFYVAARLYLLPLVSRLRAQQILVPILLLHSTRHLGMMFLTRGATYPGLPRSLLTRRRSAIC
jgi:hypothetical protein